MKREENEEKNNNANTVMKQRSELPLCAVFSFFQHSSWSRGNPMPPLGFDSLIHSN